jgi:protein-S-isoprenylcysteine O-methyltransferase Ste14
VTIVNVIYGIWVALLALWLGAGLSVKSTARTESASSRLPHLALMIVAYGLIFNPRIEILNNRFVPDSASTRYAGLAITVAGIAFAIWARFSLGRNWSSNVTVKVNHELRRDGPYAFVRHPIYSGLLLGLFGTALAIGEMRALIGFVLAFIGWRTKSLVEERFMQEQFGDRYSLYKREVKALIPFVY